MRNGGGQRFLYSSLLITLCSSLINSSFLITHGDAREVPVELKARYLRYQESEKTMVATGEVHVTLDNVEFITDKLYLNTETNTATSEGSVKIESGQYKAKAKSFRYSASQKKFQIENFRAAFLPPEDNVKGKV